MKTCATLLVIVLFAQQATAGQGPQASLVSRAALDAAVQSMADRRAVNLTKIRRVLDDDDMQRAARGLADVRRLSRGLDLLDDDTLERLAVESDKVRQQQAPGRTRKILLIVLFTLVILAMLASSVRPSS